MLIINARRQRTRTLLLKQILDSASLGRYKRVPVLTHKLLSENRPVSPSDNWSTHSRCNCVWLNLQLETRQIN